MEARNSHNQTSQYVLDNENDLVMKSIDQQKNSKQNTYSQQEQNRQRNCAETAENNKRSSPKHQQKNSHSQSEIFERNPDSLDNVTSSQKNTSNGSIGRNYEATNEYKDKNDENRLDYDQALVKNQKQGQKKQDGSLLGLINSEFFNIHMLFGYLHKSPNEGVLDILIHKLYSEPIKSIDFYLPQLCYMILTKKQQTTRMEKFLLETAIKHKNIAVKAFQLFQSYSEDVTAQYQEKSIDFYNTLEQTLVNGDIPLRYAQNKITPLKRFEEYKDKQHKADYMNLQIIFVDLLKRISIKLKTLNINERPRILREKIQEMNDWIQKNVRNQIQEKEITTESKYYHEGVILPISEGDDVDPFVIMNIIPELACPFNTKMRTPIKVVFETVRLSEIISMDKSRHQYQNHQDADEEPYFDVNKEQEDCGNNSNRNGMNQSQEDDELNNIEDAPLDTQLGITMEDDDNHENNPFNIDPFTNMARVQIKDFPEGQVNEQNIGGRSNKNSDIIKRQIDHNADFTGFDKFAKFVEFDERLFSNQIQKTNSELPDNYPLKTAQSQIFTSDQVQQVSQSTKTQSAKSSPKNSAQHNFEKEKKSKNDQSVSMKFDLSDPYSVDQIIEKYAERKSSSNKGDFDRQSSNGKNNRASGVSSSNFDEWDLVSESEVIMEGMEDPFKEKWTNICRKYKEISQYGHFKTFRLSPMIVKANDDLRQEVLAIQLMKRLQQIFSEAGLSIYLRPYEIFITSSNSGIIEYIPDTISIDGLKKKFPKAKGGKPWNMRTFFERYYQNNFEEAQKHFVESLAGYSLFNYLFNVKDRHNGNIMLDKKGHIVHIDFGFMLQNFPGGVIGFENAPFKLTQEYIDLMDGQDSEMYLYFKSLLIRGFFEIRKHLDDILTLIEILMQDSKMPCFVKPQNLINEIKDRISMKYNTGISEKQTDFHELVERIVKGSANNWRTGQYDSFQKMTNGIEK